MLLRLVICAILLALNSYAGTTTITGNLTDASGNPANGFLSITWPTFKASDGRILQASAAPRIVPVVNGVLNVALEPNDTSTPVSFYTITYFLGSTAPSEFWFVPTTNTIDWSGVETSSPPEFTPTTPLSQVTASSCGVAFGSVGGVLTQDITHFCWDDTLFVLKLNSTGVYGWGSGALGSLDTGFSRFGAAVVGLGNGTFGDFTGTLQLSGIVANGVFVNNTFTNDAAGTTLFNLVKLSSTTTLVAATVSDTAIPVYAVQFNAGTSGKAQIAVANFATCQMDASGSTAGHYLVASTTTAARCHDAGATVPTTGVFVVGQVTQTVGANATANYLVLGWNGGGSGGGGSGTVNSGTATHLSYYATSTTAISDAGADLVFNGTHTYSSASTLIWNLSTAAHTLAMQVGTTAGKPATCTIGETYFATDATAGQQIFECSSTNTWTQQLNSGGGSTTTVAVKNVESCVPAGASGTAYTCTMTTAPSALSDLQNLFFAFVPDVTNTGTAPTLAPNGLAAKVIVHRDGSGLTVNEFTAGKIYNLTYDGTAYEIVQDKPVAGATGAITINYGVSPNTIDVNTAVVPLLSSANIFTGIQSNTPSVSQTISAVGNTVLCNANIVQVNPSSNLTLTSTPTISAATNDGTRCSIINVSATSSLTLQDEAVLASTNLLLGGSNISVGPKQNVVLVYNSAIGKWLRELNSVTGGGGGGGSVTNVSFTGGLISVGTPTTTPSFTVAGTSGGIIYFSGAATWASSGALAVHGPVLGGGAGAAPVTASPGTAGQVFTSNGAGADPTFQTGSAGVTLTSPGFWDPWGLADGSAQGPAEETALTVRYYQFQVPFKALPALITSSSYVFTGQGGHVMQCAFYDNTGTLLASGNSPSIAANGRVDCNITYTFASGGNYYYAYTTDCGTCVMTHYNDEGGGVMSTITNPPSGGISGAFKDNAIRATQGGGTGTAITMPGTIGTRVALTGQASLPLNTRFFY